MDEAVERLKKEFQPEEIYLFGSHAWCAPTEDSDVDLMVIVPHSEEPAIRRMQRAHPFLTAVDGGGGGTKIILLPVLSQNKLGNQE